MNKILVKDLDKSKFDFDKKYYLKENGYCLNDLAEDAIVKFRVDGNIDKRTFLHLTPGFAVTGGRPKKAPLAERQKKIDFDDPKNLRSMFQSCFDVKEVTSLIDKAKEVAIVKGNQKMIQFLLEQLFGKASQYITHAGDKDNPILRKEVSDMSDEEVDEYLSRVVETETENNNAKKGKS